jgi:hypothetical protein
MAKKLVILIIIALGCYAIYDYNLLNVVGLIRDIKHEVIVPSQTYYSKNTIITYVKNTKDFVPHSKQDILNIYYTVLNNGWNNFTFYCPLNYPKCIDDVKVISSDKEKTLSHLNSF